MERFWSKVDKSGDCWEWTASKNKYGYGRFGVGPRKSRKNLLAHRFALELEGSDIPSGMCVCHTCDNPGCVNPDHLFIATHLDNMRDMKKKGRRVNHIGKQNGMAKLSDKDIHDIRGASGTNIDIARKYGVSNQLISRIRLRQSWKHI